MPKIIDKETKRRHVMQAAYELFLVKGYKSVTTREIALKAGISKGILYHYFTNKEDLFYETIREHIVQTVTVKTALQESGVTPRERFDRLIRICEESQQQRQERFQIMFDFIVYCSDKKLVNELLGSIYDEIRAVVRKIIADAFPSLRTGGGDIEVYCNIIMAFLDGIYFQHYINPHKARLHDTNSLFWDIIRDKLCSVSSAPTERA